jgi:serine/threonine-protein kinase
MTEVYDARDRRLGRDVAIVWLRADFLRDPTFLARFRRTTQLSAMLNHPSIVAVYDTGEQTVRLDDGDVVARPYVVTEYVDGRTLREILRSEGRPFEVGQALSITADVLGALGYSHRAGIVHRDIKPGNVMLTRKGAVKVRDFGIALALDDTPATTTQTRSVIGTAEYLSPEQARGEQVDTRSDLYSTGCLLFELLTGRPPFLGDTAVAVAYQHVREDPPVPSRLAAGIPEVVDRLVLHSLAKDRAARYQSAAEFRDDVLAAAAGRAISVLAPGERDDDVLFTGRALKRLTLRSHQNCTFTVTRSGVHFADRDSAKHSFQLSRTQLRDADVTRTGNDLVITLTSTARFEVGFHRSADARNAHRALVSVALTA